MKTRNISFRVLWLAPLAAVLGLSLPSGSSLAQVGSNTSFFEIDGDYGSSIRDTDGDGLADITDGISPARYSTWARRSTAHNCYDWSQRPIGSIWPKLAPLPSTRKAFPYMGTNMYVVHCDLSDPTSPPGRRNEQMILANWTPGADRARYFSFAVMLAQALPAGHGTFITQWHQDGDHPPPLRLNWGNDNGTNKLGFGVRYDYIDSNHRMQEDGWDRVGDIIPVSVGVWYRFLVRITPGESGEVVVWQVDNQTGAWEEVGVYQGQVGFLYASCDDQPAYPWEPVCIGDFRPFEPGYGTPEAVRLEEGDNRLEYQWKVGQYVNETDIIRIYYDNIAYGKRWNNVTKNRLTGYHKTVLSLPFEEGQGTTVNDHSWLQNGGQPGDPVRDYNNDGRIVGTALWNGDGVDGKSLRFDGSSYVSVPMDTTDFDLGNYATFACWFRTTNHPTNNKGLIFIDENALNWKVRLYISDTNLMFGVKHPDGTNSTVHYKFPAGTYADGEWHHVVGTFNRFSRDGRIKLYIDGDRKIIITGYNKPMLRGDQRLTIGKYATNGFFVGDLDEVLVRNYAMTDAEVAELYNFYRR